ncbi:porin family protein [Microvirga sp. c23x22]|uniref:Porin family protein n=1 Tax=Microvirga terricola TaxID=2719797 RepID=A0ABX0VH26_9HYPH|nr:porin family protein [Microvirga terricola]
MVALALGATGLPALAADLPPAPVLEESGDEASWYLRGDIGVVDKIVARRGRDFGSDEVPPLIKSRFARDLVISGGVGYRFAPWLRADVTVDHHFEAAFRGARFSSSANYAQDRTDFEATTFLANGYVDLAFWESITPYLGAGIGVSSNRFDSGNRLAVISDAAQLVPLRSRTQNAFAWTLMAGIAFDITSNLTLDLGYRYTHLGNTRTGFEGADIPLRANAVAAHELRIGARYRFD